jgi:hypothetical protein
MFRFDRLIRSSMTVGDVKLEYPQAVLIFERYGFRDVCDDCSIEIVARRQGLSPLEVVDELNRILFGDSLDAT